MRISSVIKLVAAAGSLATALVFTEQVAAQRPVSPTVCMAKMTQGKTGGDHRFVLAVRADKAADLETRGFVRTECDERRQFAKTRQQMCDLSARATPALDAEFKQVYSITPSEICQLSTTNR